MKTIKRILSIVAVAGVLLGNTMAINAGAPEELRTSELWVSAGGYKYTSISTCSHVKTNMKDKQCYMRLVAFKLNYYPENNIPSDKFIYSRLYNGAYTAGSDCAGFHKISKAGDYNYKYLKNFGNKSDMYILKSNSSSNNAYWAKFSWSANPWT